MLDNFRMALPDNLRYISSGLAILAVLLLFWNKSNNGNSSDKKENELAKENRTKERVHRFRKTDETSLKGR